MPYRGVESKLVSKLVCPRCIDLQAEEYLSEVRHMLVHLSFPSELAITRICCVLWSDEAEIKLADQHLQS